MTTNGKNWNQYNGEIIQAIEDVVRMTVSPDEDYRPLTDAMKAETETEEFGWALTNFADYSAKGVRSFTYGYFIAWDPAEDSPHSVSVVHGGSRMERLLERFVDDLSRVCEEATFTVTGNSVRAHPVSGKVMPSRRSLQLLWDLWLTRLTS